ncbi:MAG: hypothetical protein E6J34_08760, partial [Chloroflexi bacterium]
IFDKAMDERYFRKVAQSSYYPATRMFLDLVRRQGLRLSIGFSLSFVRQAMTWDHQLLDLFKELVAEENVELIGVDPYHSFLFLLDLPAFVLRMQEMASELEQIFGKRPLITDTTEMCMSASLYNALDTAGFRGMLVDGRGQALGWRESTHLYFHGDERPYTLPIRTGRGKRIVSKLAAKPVQNERSQAPYLLSRHVDLSDDVGFRFTNHGWSRYPLYADTYADWIANARGDYILLGWDFETFGEHHRQESGIFDFAKSLPGELLQRNVACYTASQLIDRHQQHAHYLPLPLYPTTWADSGEVDFFLGNSAQQSMFRLMGHVYNMAKLTENQDLIDLAIWLTQSDNLHLIQWYGRGGSEAGVSAYFTPREWWSMGANRLINEYQQVYVNALQAMEPYLPIRFLRRSEKKHVARSSNKATPQLEPELVGR